MKFCQEARPHGDWTDSIQQEGGSNLNKDILLNVSVMPRSDERWYGEEERLLNYKLERSETVLKIDRSMNYLSRIENGGPIEPISYSYVPFEWDFPNLDLKILNNSDQTIFLTDVLFEIEESRLDSFPVIIIPHIYKGNAFHFRLNNEGWGLVEDLVVKYNLTPRQMSRRQLTANESYSHEITVGDFSETCNVNISDSLSLSGVDVDRLASLNPHHIEKTEVEKHVGPFNSGRAFVQGELSFKGTKIDGLLEEKTIKFSTSVWLYNEILYGAPAPPSYQYRTKFLVEGKNYQRSASISHILKAGDGDRFNVQIGMDKSSHHLFRVKILYNEGNEIESPWIKLTSFVPRSGVEYLRNNTN